MGLNIKVVIWFLAGSFCLIFSLWSIYTNAIAGEYVTLDNLIYLMTGVSGLILVVFPQFVTKTLSEQEALLAIGKLSAVELAEFQALIKDKKMIPAISFLREKTGMGLMNAKQVVEFYSKNI